MRVAGIMSGTSLDGIDVAIVEIRGRRIETIGFQTTPYPAPIRERILACAETGGAREISRLNFELGESICESRAARHRDGSARWS